MNIHNNIKKIVILQVIFFYFIFFIFSINFRKRKRASMRRII